MTILQNPNPGKSLTVEINEQKYLRFPVKTPVIKSKDDLLKILKDELEDFHKDGDILLVAESVVAIAQSRAYKFDEIKYGFWAKSLSRFVKKTPRGIGLGTPQTMQLAIDEVGLWRILLAAAVHALSIPFGIRGNFYRVAGERARGIDGPTENTLPPYNKYATLLPKNPAKFAKDLEAALLPKKLKVIVIDANDIGVNILGEKDKKWIELAKALAKDNPLGQSHERTPALLCRKV